MPTSLVSDAPESALVPSTSVQVLPESALRKRPEVLVPQKMTAPFCGSTASFSPELRPSPLPCAVIVRAQDHRLPVAEIARSGEDVKSCRVIRVKGERLRPVKAAVLFRDPVHERDPVFRRRIPAVGAAYIRADIDKIFLRAARDNAVHESTAFKADIPPGIGIRRGKSPRGDRRGSEKRRAKKYHLFYRHNTPFEKKPTQLSLI